jgi:cobalt/nickel transport system permease protein
MHMSDALLSVAVGTTMNAVSTGAIGLSVAKIKRYNFEESQIPMMGVMGAFVFAAQMINFTIPITGSSGHIGGGILLAALLGPFPAVITLSCVLLIQCLFFADGGLLALGCNIFNIAVLPCLVAYPLIYKSLLRRKLTRGRLTLAAIMAVVVGLQLGAFGVVTQTLLSGITELPFTAFVAVMQPIHLAIGIVEGVVTAAVLCFIYNVRRDIILKPLASQGLTQNEKAPNKKLYIILAIVTILVGGLLSWYASTKPDGLEWSISKVTNGSEIKNDTKVHDAIGTVQDNTAFLPDYSFEEDSSTDGRLGTSLSGIVGGLITLAIAMGSGALIMLYKSYRNRDREADSMG